MLDPGARRLFHLYLDITVPKILAAPAGYSNPFASEVVRWAFADPLIMNIILALGGFPLGDTDDPDLLERSRLQYYGEAVKALQDALTNVNDGSTRSTTRLLLATMLLCTFESMRGNPQGVFCSHLSASRVFAHALDSPEQELRDDQLTRILVEYYAFYELCSKVRLDVDHQEPGLCGQSMLLQVEHLRSLSGFGVFFGSSWSLYRVVPRICELAAKRRCELAKDIDLGCLETFRELQDVLSEWRCEEGPQPVACDPDHQFSDARAAAGELVRNSLLLFLYSSMFSDREFILGVSQPIVNASIKLLPIVHPSSFANTSFWPFLVIATYATTPEQQTRILGFLPPIMPLVVRATQILRWVWNSSQNSIGLQALADIIHIRNISYCFG
ncbi:fungal-specific transcription factor domain-containing protein [Microdochium trichocladiopsis]|uniref:Fungal-specific transcription factor domain-containing protein n=1 Tax=Microdochium trichocladiopsis TaxID=1682393 RepID=A0A9P8YA17_9PEZI|nr:fungal-specific transcription factor domain-containing protein [Microdochium trichocladiopsis]KAH7034673.1 fungal-specific transcription factor domain-containing protein [Microdochium trichocladiopsis]